MNIGGVEKSKHLVFLTTGNPITARKGYLQPDAVGSNEHLGLFHGRGDDQAILHLLHGDAVAHKRLEIRERLRGDIVIKGPEYDRPEAGDTDELPVTKMHQYRIRELSASVGVLVPYPFEVDVGRKIVSLECYLQV